MTDDCPHCGQPMPEPYQAPKPVHYDMPSCKPLLDEWNRLVCNGLPSHPLSTAMQWMAPVLPALRARAGQGDPVALWSTTLTAWLAHRGGKRVQLRWFCADLPDMLAEPVKEQPSRTARLFPVASTEPDTTEYLPPEQVAALARELVQKRQLKG